MTYDSLRSLGFARDDKRGALGMTKRSLGMTKEGARDYTYGLAMALGARVRPSRQIRYNASAFLENSAVCSSRLKPDISSV